MIRAIFRLVLGDNMQLKSGVAVKYKKNSAGGCGPADQFSNYYVYNLLIKALVALIFQQKCDGLESCAMVFLYQRYLYTFLMKLLVLSLARYNAAN